MKSYTSRNIRKAIASNPAESRKEWFMPLLDAGRIDEWKQQRLAVVATA